LKKEEVKGGRGGAKWGREGRGPGKFRVFPEEQKLRGGKKKMGKKGRERHSKPQKGTEIIFSKNVPMSGQFPFKKKAGEKEEGKQGWRLSTLNRVTAKTGCLVS